MRNISNYINLLYKRSVEIKKQRWIFDFHDLYLVFLPEFVLVQFQDFCLLHTDFIILALFASTERTTGYFILITFTVILLTVILLTLASSRMEGVMILRIVFIFLLKSQFVNHLRLSLNEVPYLRESYFIQTIRTSTTISTHLIILETETMESKTHSFLAITTLILLHSFNILSYFILIIDGININQHNHHFIIKKIF